jgi:hypothetical protein
MLIRTGVTFSSLGTSLLQSFAVAGVAAVWAAFFLAALGAGVVQLATRSGSGTSAPVDRCWFAALTMLGALLGFIVYVKWAGYLSAWHFLSVLGLAGLCIDTLLAELADFPRLRAYRLAGVIVAALVLLPPAWRETQVRATNVDRAAENLASSARAGDLIVVNPWNISISFQRYYTGKVSWVSIPAMSGISFHRYDFLKREMMTPDPLQPLLDQIAKTLKEGNQVWLVGHVYFPREGSGPPVLKSAPQEGFWSDAIYTTGWSFQEGYFLRAHARVADLVGTPSGQVVSPEDVSLLRLSGWKD